MLAKRDFRLLWVGQGTSQVGDQFTQIALLSLVPRLTGDPLALGLVLRAGGHPSAFTLVRGAITDRFRPGASR